MVLPQINQLARGRSKLHLAADCVLGLVAAFVATGGMEELRASPWRFSTTAVIALSVWLFTARVLRQYDAWKGRGRFSAFRGQGVFSDLILTSLLVLAVVTVLAVARLAVPHHVDLDLTRFLSSLWPGALCLRLVATAIIVERTREADSVLIVGAGSLGRVTGEDIRDSFQGRSVHGYLRFPGEARSGRLPAPLLGSSDELEKVLRRHAIAEVYLAGYATQHGEAMQAAIRMCESFGVPFALPAHGFRLNRARPIGAKPDDGYTHFVNLEPKPTQMLLKRLFDMAASAIALWLLSPVLVAVAIAIKLTSRGPILFRQTRVGMYGRAFHMLKFRSMVENAEELRQALMTLNEQSGPVFKMRRDPRITPIGRFIRKFSIDELPQLVNVLRGEMSIVGPRPPLSAEVAKYEPWQHRRLSVRPGLTCVWQVSGRNEVSFEEWMYLDMRYIDNWSLGQDFNLILKTLPVVLTGKGAS